MPDDHEPWPSPWRQRVFAWLVVGGAIAAAVAISLRPGWSGSQRFAVVVAGAILGALALMVPWIVVRSRAGTSSDGEPRS